MDVIHQKPSARETEWMHTNRQELVERIARAMHTDGTSQPFPGLYLYRHSFPLEQVYSVVEPSLSLRLDLAPSLVGEVMVEVGHSTSRDQADMRAIDVSPLDGHLLDAMVRVARLLDDHDEARVLLPLITREIIYRLLRGEQGSRLRHLAILGGYSPSIARAIERLSQDFDQPLRIESLARELGMSVSVFHHHFKAVTAISPLQFQKRLRLLEARRLMLGEDFDAASAAYRVGYHDASHFNREYKSLFGVPPMRDVQRLRDEALQSAGR